jgi:hypothetical protein
MKKPTRTDRDTRPPKMPPASLESVSKIPDVPLPDANTLSILAAQVRFNSTHQFEAVRNALALWREAQSLIESQREFVALRYEGYIAPLLKIRRPRKWPASFAEFLRLVVQGKDEGEQLNRFRRYWLSNIRSQKAFKAGRTRLSNGRHTGSSLR